LVLVLLLLLLVLLLLLLLLLMLLVLLLLLTSSICLKLLNALSFKDLFLLCKKRIAVRGCKSWGRLDFEDLGHIGVNAGSSGDNRLVVFVDDVVHLVSKPVGPGKP
jgi:hypothetical protein